MAEAVEPEPDRPGHACPCGCDRHVADQTGWFVGMTRYVQAAVTILGHMAAVAEEPAAERIRDAQADAQAILELLLEWCHDDTGTTPTRQVYALTTIWEGEFRRLAAGFDAIDSEAYRRWLGETTPQRAMRHGAPTMDDAELMTVIEVDLEVEDVEW